MSRRKRTSARTLNRALQILAGLKAFVPPPDMGAALTIEAFAAEISDYSKLKDEYNLKLATLDDETNQLDDFEQRLSDLNQRLVAAVKAHYGPDSSEYELVGGVRRSDRKKRVRQLKPTVS